MKELVEKWYSAECGCIPGDAGGCPGCMGGVFADDLQAALDAFPSDEEVERATAAFKQAQADALFNGTGPMDERDWIRAALIAAVKGE